MTIPVQQFPVLDAGQMSPWHQALQSGIDTYSKINKAAYEPLKTKAQALSQLAYAQLMGPQFLAKALGNENILASLPPDQQQRALQLITAAGMGGGSGSSQLGGQSANPLEKMVDFVKNAFSFGGQPSQQQGGGIDMSNLSPQDIQAANNMQPGQSYVIQGNGPNRGYSYDQGGNNTVASPEQLNQQFPEGAAAQNAPAQTSSFGPNTVAENVARFKGIKSEGEELGTQRGKAVADLDEQYQTALESEAPVNNLISLSQKPEFQNLRRFPFFQDTQLKALSKIGTPAEQRMIGNYIVSANNVLKAAITSFRGRILDKEIGISQNMKISDNDTWNTMMGKLEAIPLFNRMIMQRNRIAVKMIQGQHLNRGDALERADRYVDGNKIRSQIQNQINPPPGESDIQHMMNVYKQPREKIIERLRAKGYTNVS